MSEKEWFKSTGEGTSPFDISYIEEFELPQERTAQELESLSYIISTMSRKPRTLDIAGGFGRISSELVRQDLVNSLTNLDLNREFLHIARKNQVTNTVEGNMRHLCFQDSSFDLALIMFTTFGYFGDEDNFMVLQEAHRVLDNGGILVLDLPNYCRISSNFSANREMRLRSGGVIEYRKRIEGEHLIEERTMTTRSGVKKNLLPIKLRIYSPKEIVGLCQEAGFKAVKTVDQDLKEFSPDSSRRLWVISTK